MTMLSALMKSDHWEHVKTRWDNKPMTLGLDRVVTVLKQLEKTLMREIQRPEAKVITVGGTNGKGSTCAMLEYILSAAGYRVACYTSPHLLSFRERIRIEQTPSSDKDLNYAFDLVMRCDPDIILTPFEAETLAAFVLFSRLPLDVWVLEIGLGGRLDAVNVIDADCSILTCVDIDHAAILGPDRESIGFEKAHIFRAGRPAICVDPIPPQSVVKYAEAIGADLWLFGRDFNYSGDRQQWSFAGRHSRRNSLAYPALRGANQLLNASGALAALDALRGELAVPQQAVRQGLSLVDVPGRFQVLSGRPVVVLDVAHNPHAAAHLAANLDQMGFFPYTYGVFGMLADKDIAAVIGHLKSRIDHWICVDLSGPRAATGQALAELLRASGVTDDADHSVTISASPQIGLGIAKSRANENDRIIVFGSHLTVADVLSSQLA